MDLDNTLILPAKHFVTTEDKKAAALTSIKAELDAQLANIHQRNVSRTAYKLV